ncbi:MAG: TonB family protein [Cyanobacteria bacterium P01_H01_bin.15]
MSVWRQGIKLMRSHGVAGGFSLGLHVAFLGLLLPEIAGKWQAPTPPLAIDLLELSAAEQERLPELNPTDSIPGIAAPEVALLQPERLITPSLPPPPSFATSQVPLFYPRLPVQSLPPYPSSTLPTVPLESPVTSSANDVIAESNASASEDQPLPPPPNFKQWPEVDEESIPNSAWVLQSPPRDQEIDSSPEINLPASTQARLAVQLQLRAENLVARAANTTDEEAQKNYLDWRDTEALVEQPETLSIEGEYPLDACVRKLEGIAEYGVTVNEAGVPQNLRVLKSSGYGVFDDQAIADIRSRPLDGSKESYLIKVNYDYDSELCPDLSVAAAPETRAPELEVPDSASTEEGSAVEPGVESETPGSVSGPEDGESAATSEREGLPTEVEGSNGEVPTLEAPVETIAEPADGLEPAEPATAAVPEDPQEIPIAPDSLVAPEPQAEPVEPPPQKVEVRRIDEPTEQAVPVAPEDVIIPDPTRDPKEVLGGPLEGPNPFIEENLPQGNPE